MALTKVTGGTISTTGNYHTNNINSSGIITATKFVGPFEGDVSGIATGANKIKTVDESSDTTCFPLFVNNTTDVYQAAKLGSNLTFNSSTGDLGATKVTANFAGNITGTGATFTTLDVSGTLNYTHVTDVYSVGVATFQNNVQVGAGISVVGVSTFTNGVGIADTIFHTGDTDTYLGFPGANLFKVATGGSTRIYIDSGGLIWNRKDTSGVSTTTMLLNHATNANGNGVSLAFAPTQNYPSRYSSIDVVQDGNNNMDMLFKTTDATQNEHSIERLRIDSSGRVLIGTQTEGTPTYGEQLTIANSGTHCGMTIRSATNGVGSIYFSDGTSGNSEYRGYIEYHHTTGGVSDYFKIGTGAAERLRIRNDGNVILWSDLAVTGVTTSSDYDLSAVSVTSGLESPYDHTGNGEVVFVYDTRKDADGGAWRKKTSQTSWYNEGSGSNRGTRKEFPAVAVIVVGQVRVTIYDADDPTMPMWMKFQAGNPYMIGCNDDYPSCVDALNGVICIGDAENYGGLQVIDFVKDTCRRIRGAATTNGTNGWWPTGIAGRNGTGAGDNLWAGGRGYDNTNLGTLVSDNINSVSIKAFRNAPVDEVTGLPIPTIAVACNSGITILSDNWFKDTQDKIIVPTQQISDITSSNGGYTWGRSVVWTDNDDLVFVMGDGNGNLDYLHSMNGYSKRDNSITIDAKTGGHQDVRNMWRGNTSSSSIYSNLLSQGSDRAITGNTHQHKINQVIAMDGYDLACRTRNGLSLIVEDPSRKDGLVACATTTYNTGWQFGRTGLVTLADTDTTNLTRANLIQNGTFASASNWSLSGTGAFSISGGKLNADGTSGSSFAQQAVSPAVLKTNSTYTVKCVVTHSSGQLKLRMGNSGYSSNIGSTGTHYTSMTCGSTPTETLLFYGEAWSGTVDDVEVYVEETDHTDNNKGLQVYGTITKQKVATGADLVSYSGWSTSNHFIQAYTDKLDFGTGDFCYMYWINPNESSSGKTIFSRSDRDVQSNGTNSTYIMNYFNGEDLRVDLSAAGVTYQGFQNSGGPNREIFKTWMLVCIVKRGDQLEIWINGRREYAHALNDDQRGKTFSASNSILRIGHDANTASPDSDIELALFRAGPGAPSRAQIERIYKDELPLFKENGKCILVDAANDRILGLSYDKSTGSLHVGGKGGRAEFRGLSRINNNTTEVTRGVSASNEFVVEY